jgi:hypothetical protein
MITRQTVTQYILNYLNGHITLAQLVEWAEQCMVDGGFYPDKDIDMLVNIVMYLAGADTDYFPLTWEICTEFLSQLGVQVQVVTQSLP